MGLGGVRKITQLFLAGDLEFRSRPALNTGYTPVLILAVRRLILPSKHIVADSIEEFAMNAVSRVTSHIQSQTVIFQRGVLALALAAMPAMAFAQTVSGGASPATMLNNVCTFILGPFGETIAVLGIIGIGFLFMFGRASLGVIAGVVGGIVIMFGASYLGQTLTGG
jgi:type IV secretory pathway VirB2 component (pilin)